MKRNINKIVLVVASVFILSACNKDRFNILPNHEDTPESVFTTEKNYRYVVDGAYDYLKSAYSGDTGNLLVVGDALADNLIFSNEGRETNKSAYEWSFTADTGAVTASYADFYRVISRANLVLDNISKVPTSQYMKNIEAEARAIRAVAHFELVRAFSKIPTQDADALNSLGISYVTEFEPRQKPYRDATVKETYDKILADLLFSKDNVNDTNGVGRLDKASILGYLSKIYLYLGDYDKAVEYGEQCIALKPSVGTSSNFSGIWTDSTQDGVLFTILNKDVSSDNVKIGTGFNQKHGATGIRSEFYANYDLVKSYDANDVRKNAYITTSPYNGTQYNHITKYDTKVGSSVASVVNVKLLRTADVYLTVAEALIKKSAKDEGRALTLLNTLRKERYTNFVNGNETGNALLEAILKERRLELAFENDRFWTIKRLGESVVRSDYGSAVDGTGSNVPTGDIKTLSSGDHRFVLPIPNSAIRVNANIKQNPKY